MRTWTLGWETSDAGGYAPIEARSFAEACRELRYLLSEYGAGLRITSVWVDA